MNPLAPSSPTARRRLTPMWGWMALVALTQMGMAARGCQGTDPTGDTGTGGGSGRGCDIDGHHYAVGEGFRASDGCNSCSCTANGDATCTLIGCQSYCGGSTGVTCAADEYCDYSPLARCGVAGAMGNCASKPTSCTEQFDPVCGCDGKTYGNTCDAAAQGVSVAASGKCGDTGSGGSGGGGSGGGGAGGGGTGGSGMGGGPDLQCTSDADCPQPPCACLDEDHDNVCDNHCPTMGCRNEQCVDVSPQPPICGGLLGTGCAQGEFCRFALAARCGAADATGTCEDKPQVCNEIYAPVCGCDGKTYANSCFAAGAGFSVAVTGECGAGATLGLGDSCGGFVRANAPTCGDGLFCQFQPGALCGAADAPGECVAIPTSCPATNQPVCGCNGITYSNACNAALAQVGILDTGRCN